MNTRLAAVAFLDSKQPAGPVHRSIIAVDLEGSTTRTNPVKGEIRRAMYAVLGHALEAVSITGNRLEPLADRGDGVLVLVKPHDDVPKTVLLDRLVPLLAAQIAEHNARAPLPALRIRLRVVVHAGEVHADGRGWYGEAIDVAIRLLDAPPVKKTLKQATQAPLVLVVSNEIYTGLICQGYVNPDTYRRLVRVHVGNRWHYGWVHVPQPGTAAFAATPAPDRRMVTGTIGRNWAAEAGRAAG
jgi:hypothetical protein